MRAPRSLRGQILLAVLLALAVAQALGAAIAVASRREGVRAAQIGDAFERTAALVYVLERTPPGLADNLMRVAETPATRLSLTTVPSLVPEAAGPGRWVRRLQAALGDDTPRALRMAIGEAGVPGAPPRSDAAEDEEEDDRAPSGRGPRHRPRPPEAALEREALRAAIPLADGRWLNATIRFPKEGRGLPPLPLLSFALAAFAIAAALWLTLARILGPLRRLAVAADGLGRGEAGPDLPVTGPTEMRALTAAFNAMGHRLHRMVNARTQMLAALGHDLRSPLTALRIEAEMVDDDEARDRLMVPLDEMAGMIDQTLTYARGVWTTEAVEEVDLGALVSVLAEGAALDLPAGPVPMRLRPATLRRALRNLIDNARRYGGGAVEIALRAGDRAAVIDIADRGPGIPEAQLAQVFDPYVRLEASRSRETGGTGLGLAIARAIVQAHGGEVTLANRPGGGLIARVILPRAAAEGAAP